MDMPMEAKELISIGKKLNIDINTVSEYEAKNIIDSVIEKFHPFNLTTHLAIGEECKVLSLEEWEFSYMDRLQKEPGYIFFQQRKKIYKETIAKINDVRLLGKILEQSFGMEYFLTNSKTDFLIAVNWYAIEVAGTAKINFT